MNKKEYIEDVKCANGSFTCGLRYKLQLGGLCFACQKDIQKSNEEVKVGRKPTWSRQFRELLNEEDRAFISKKIKESLEYIPK